MRSDRTGVLLTAVLCGLLELDAEAAGSCWQGCKLTGLPRPERGVAAQTGGGCDTTFGFGTAPAANAAQPAAPAAGAAPGATAATSPPAAAPAAAPAQQSAASTAAAAPAVLPAFLQPAAIKTAYGSNNGGVGGADGKCDKGHQ